VGPAAPADVRRERPGRERAQGPVRRCAQERLGQPAGAQLLQQQPRVQVAVALPHRVGGLAVQAGSEEACVRTRPAPHAVRARTEAHLLCQLAQPLLNAHARLPLEQLQVLLNLQDDLQAAPAGVSAATHLLCSAPQQPPGAAP